MTRSLGHPMSAVLAQCPVTWLRESQAELFKQLLLLFFGIHLHRKCLQALYLEAGLNC